MYVFVESQILTSKESAAKYCGFVCALIVFKFMSSGCICMELIFIRHEQL